MTCEKRKMSPTIAVLTVSDSCSKGQAEDKSGPRLDQLIREYFKGSVTVLRDCCPDDYHEIITHLRHWIEKGECNVILTTGGTGFGVRDVTPEATKSLLERDTPGLIHALIGGGLKHTPKAMLTRGCAGITQNTLIINLPGSLRAIEEGFDILKDVLEHAIALITNDVAGIQQEHNGQILMHSLVQIENVASRSRKSDYPLIEIEQAFDLIEETLLTMDHLKQIETISIDQSLYRILAQDLYSQEAHPQFPASIKDGYAVNSNESYPGIKKVQGSLPAGSDSKGLNLKAGHIIRIGTGAPIPAGADAVVQIEDTDLISTTANGLDELEVRIRTVPKTGQDIRPVGSDLPSNTKILSKYQQIFAPEIGLLATVGLQTVQVFKRPIVGLLSTGNELVNYTRGNLQKGQIRDTNKLTLINLLKEFNYPVQDFGISPDEPNSLKTNLDKALKKCDIIITTGGVSMGELDLIKRVLQQDFQAKIHFGRINMKPGKPTTFASLTYQDQFKLVFGLPGNPVSAGVTCMLFVIPALRLFEGALNWKMPILKVWVEGPIENKDSRPEYVRINLHRNPANILEALPNGNQISSRLNSLVNCQGLLLIPGQAKVQQEFREVHLIRSLF